MKVSVIVPAYNAEKYIAETLDCLLAQTLGDIEIIVVNDGSTDSTAAIIESYCEKHKNIISIEQKNAGVSAARNHGLESATGEFVLFLDSDDLISGSTLELFYNRLTETGADIGICRLASFGFGGEEFNAYADSLAAKDEIDCFDKQLLWNFLVGNKCYRRELLIRCGIRFPLLRYSEEGAFFMRVVLLAEPKIIGVDGAVMRYRRHTAQQGFSVSQSISGGLFSDFCGSLELIYDAAEQAAIPAEEREGYLQEIIYKTAYILIMQFYRLLWRTDAKTLEQIGQKYVQLTAMMTEETSAKLFPLYKDIGKLCFLRAEIAAKPLISIILPHASSEAIGSVYLQSMPSFELFVDSGADIPDMFAGCENLHILSEKGFKAAARKAAKGKMVFTFSGKKPLLSKTFKIISLLKQSKKFGFFPLPLIKLGAVILAKIRE